MTRSDYTHLAVVADRSGSMYSIVDDMNNGLESFLKEQDKLDGKLLVDIVTFDTHVTTEANDALVASVEFPIIKPRGSTALLDAIGTTVTSLGQKLEKLDEDERPGKVIVMVVTDGGENASREYTGDQVKKLVEAQTNDYSWEFMFLGANIDSFAVAGDLGFARGGTINYTADSGGTQSVLRSAMAYVSNTRSGVAASFSDEDRKNAGA